MARRLSALPLFAREAQVPGRRTTVAGRVLLPMHGAATVERWYLSSASSNPDLTDD